VNRSAEDTVDKPFRSFLGVTAGILVLALFVAGLRSYRDLSVQRSRQQALQAKIADTKVRIEVLETQIDLLRTDPGTLERVAREDLGMARPGDIVVRLEPDDEEAQAPTE
jgi:cell division protein FtsB